MVKLLLAFVTVTWLAPTAGERVDGYRVYECDELTLVPATSCVRHWDVAQVQPVQIEPQEGSRAFCVTSYNTAGESQAACAGFTTMSHRAVRMAPLQASVDRAQGILNNVETYGSLTAGGRDRLLLDVIVVVQQAPFP